MIYVVFANEQCMIRRAYRSLNASSLLTGMGLIHDEKDLRKLLSLAPRRSEHAHHSNSSCKRFFMVLDTMQLTSRMSSARTIFTITRSIKLRESLHAPFADGLFRPLIFYQTQFCIFAKTKIEEYKTLIENTNTEPITHNY